MRKPSVFSKDYEKIMRKRRRFYAGAYIVLFVILGYGTAKLVNYDFGQLRNNLQTWIDADDLQKEEDEEYIPNNEEITLVEKKKLEISINNDSLIFNIEENDGKESFGELLENNKNYYIDYSPSKESIIVLDSNQNLYVFNTKGEQVNITLDKYVAPNGEIFAKNDVLSMYNGYIWTLQPKFITESKIAYISNVPYFGYDLNKYITVVEKETNIHKTLWASKSKDIKLLERKENSLEVEIDGNIRNISEDGGLK